LYQDSKWQLLWHSRENQNNQPVTGDSASSNSSGIRNNAAREQGGDSQAVAAPQATTATAY